MAPNPFAHATRIDYALPVPAQVELTLYDAAGRARASLLAAPQGAGPHAAHFEGIADAGNLLAPGVYFLRLATGDRSAVVKVAIAR